MALLLRSGVALVLLSAPAAAAPPVATRHILRAAPKKPILFAGKVESIDMKLGTVAIGHGPIPGYMPAMTMDYPVDNGTTLRALQPGDRITATVYVGDPVLHDVQILARADGTK